MKDKIIFWLHTNLIFFGIAKFLQDKYDSDFYVIIDLSDKSKKFFQTQDLVKFQKIWYYHDHISKNHKLDLDYLRYIEEKYKINLWLLAQNERFFYRFNQFYKFSSYEILSILEQECKLFENVLDEIKPDFLIMESTLHNNHLFYEMCKARGVNALMLRSTPFGYRYMISNDPEKIDNFAITKKSTTVKTADELKNYLKGHDSFKEGTQFLNTFQKSKILYIKAATKFLLSDNSNEKTHYTYFGRTKLRVLIHMLILIFKKRYRESFMNRTFLKEINNEIPFVYFPLHIEQERVLLLGAPFYTNQLEVIRHIAKSLPVGYQLFVKEHPVMNTREWRSVAEYKQILEIPNVKLIHPSVKSDEILQRCSLVITINGSSSFEAAFYGKPSIIFTDIDFSILPFVTRVKSIEELPNTIKNSLRQKVDLSALNDYVNLVDANSFEFDYQDLSTGMQDYLHYGGFLVDVEISTDKMKSYLQKQSSVFEKLTQEYIKKIMQYKEYETKKNTIKK